MGVCSSNKKKDNLKNQRSILTEKDYHNQEIINNPNNNNNENINFINSNNNEIKIQYQLNNENDYNKNIELLKTNCQNQISELTKKHNEEIKNLKDKYNKLKEKIEEDYNEKKIYYKEEFDTKKNFLTNIKNLTEQENLSLKFNMNNKNKNDLMNKNIQNEEEYQNKLKYSDKIFFAERKREFNNYIIKKENIISNYKKLLINAKRNHLCSEEMSNLRYKLPNEMYKLEESYKNIINYLTANYNNIKYKINYEYNNNIYNNNNEYKVNINELENNYNNIIKYLEEDYKSQLNNIEANYKENINNLNNEYKYNIDNINNNYNNELENLNIEFEATIKNIKSDFNQKIQKLNECYEEMKRDIEKYRQNNISKENINNKNNQTYNNQNQNKQDINESKKEEKKINLKKEIAKRAINPDYIIDKDIVTKTKDNIINKYKEPDSVLKTTQQIESDIATLGSILKEEIIKEKNEHPEKFLNIDELVKDEKNESFAIGILAKSLEDYGICAVIEKKQENIDVSNASLQFLISGLAYKKKITMKYDYGEDENNRIIYDQKYQQKYIAKQKAKISKHLGILEKYITICNIRKGSLKNDVIIDDSALLDGKNVDPLTTLNNNFNKMTNKLKQLCTIEPDLKDVSSGMLFEGIKLSPEMFDSKGNNKDGGWAPMGEKRGGKDYYPPYGWIGHGLNVLGRYDGGDDTWIGMKNKEGEWCVAYHGTGMNCVKAILETKFKPGGGQVHANDHDLNHPGQIVGVGVYCSPKMTEVEGVYDNKDGGEYKVAFMCRVHPKKVRICGDRPDYWVVDGSSNEIRPYRLLIKKK